MCIQIVSKSSLGKTVNQGDKYYSSEVVSLVQMSHEVKLANMIYATLIRRRYD